MMNVSTKRGRTRSIHARRVAPIRREIDRRGSIDDDIGNGNGEKKFIFDPWVRHINYYVKNVDNVGNPHFVRVKRIVALARKQEVSS
jgi:hypothetical protein